MRTCPQSLRLTCLALALLALLSPLASTVSIRAVAHAAGAPVAPPPQTAYVVQPEADQDATLVKHGYFWLTASPGQTRRVRVVIKNTGIEPLRLRSYPVDSVQEPTGGIGFGTWRTALVRVGTWIRVSPLEMTLAPGQTRRVTATIHVPLKSQGGRVRAGDYVGGLAFENEQVQRRGRGSRVLIDVHYRRVIAAVLAAPGPRRAAARLGGVTLASTPPGSQAVVVLRNSGNVLLTGTGTLTVGGGGARRVTAPFTLDTVLPAATDRLPVRLPALRLRPGSYAVGLRVRSSAGASLLAWQGYVIVARPAVPAPVSAPSPNITLPPVRALADTARGHPLPWIIAGVVALLLMVGLAVGLGVAVGRRAGARRAA